MDPIVEYWGWVVEGLGLMVMEKYEIRKKLADLVDVKKLNF